MIKEKILLVEDDPSLRMVLQETLEIEGFECICAENGAEGLQKLTNCNADVVIADIMMPTLDGLEMVKRMRQRDRMTPVLFLTAKSSVENVIEGFKAGADDYLRKPFSMRELIVRIHALIARRRLSDHGPSKNQVHLIPIGSYTFDPVSQYLSFGIQTDKLSSKESEILNTLCENVNEVVSAVQIMKRVWDDDSPYVANSLQVFITRLRQRLKDDPSVRIINARGIGYKLVIDIPKEI